MTTDRLTAISNAFSQHRPAFMPYFSLGFPTYDTSLDVIQACVDNGADLIELGMPFSDPLADGPTIQHSTQVALQNGVTTAHCLEAVDTLRGRGVTTPLMLMGYVNPLLAYGLDRFAADAASAGANGLIVPDLPPEEAAVLEAACQQHGLILTYLLAPTSTFDRIRLVARKARGFTYLVSVTGVTGARTALNTALKDFIARVRAQVNTPLAVGFGISTPEQAREVGALADGVIVGSKLISLVRDSDQPAQTAAQFTREMLAALADPRYV